MSPTICLPLPSFLSSAPLSLFLSLSLSFFLSPSLSLSLSLYRAVISQNQPHLSTPPNTALCAFNMMHQPTVLKQPACTAIDQNSTTETRAIRL